MLYVFHGPDTATATDKAHALVNSLRAKRPDATYVKVDADSWSASVIEEHLGGQGLFSNKYLVFLDRLTENAEAKEILPGFIAAMNESANIFIVLEGKINAELKKAFEKSAEKIVVCEKQDTASKFGQAGAGKKEEFNIFALADALGERNPLKAWMVYRQAVDNGNEPESIIGTLFWQAKSMALAANATSAGEAGISPFVFSKAKRYAGNYSKEELGSLLGNLITLYHDGHRGMYDMELAVERLLINIR